MVKKEKYIHLNFKVEFKCLKYSGILTLGSDTLICGIQLDVQQRQKNRYTVTHTHTVDTKRQ